MKKAGKILFILIVIVALPMLAGLGITSLWNGIITSVCGFAPVSFWQGVGLFLLGQLLSGGFMILLFILFGSLHAVIHSRADWHNHWHNMTDEERLEFIRRRRDFFGHRQQPHNSGDAAE